jgi:hypothetical protein
MCGLQAVLAFKRMILKELCAKDAKTKELEAAKAGSRTLGRTMGR